MITASRATSRALLITGTVGVGKTSVADAAGALLADAGIPNAVLDLDRLCQSWPSPEGDPFNNGVLLRNLRSVASNYLDAGVERLVLAGVAESQADCERYQDAVGVDLSVCRLKVSLPVVRHRLARRHDNDPDGLRWHLGRSGKLDQILDHAQVEDFSIDATDDSIPAIAEAVLRAAGWR
ncbi:hypothetical protein [Kitasatospora sp. HPMI-4]|uniref:hypothetical protein n=1 Tax=Kitasatospora sp. HPMI-4 TaxID=3448443 RepID=UPI003F1D67DA